MRRLARALGIVLLAIALVANIAPSVAMAFPSAPAGHAHAAQDAGHEHGDAQAHDADHGASAQAKHGDCPGHANSPASHSGNDDTCKKCCGVCITASMMPVVTAPGISLVAARSSFSARTNMLTAHGPPSDPGIPKPLT
jgi:ABC-type nickel/cobalt efflux system permease component RcnA